MYVASLKTIVAFRSYMGIPRLITSEYVIEKLIAILLITIKKYINAAPIRFFLWLSVNCLGTHLAQSFP